MSLFVCLPFVLFILWDFFFLFCSAQVFPLYYFGCCCYCCCWCCSLSFFFSFFLFSIICGGDFLFCWVIFAWLFYVFLGDFLCLVSFFYGGYFFLIFKVFSLFSYFICVFFYFPYTFFGFWILCYFLFVLVLVERFLIFFFLEFRDFLFLLKIFFCIVSLISKNILSLLSYVNALFFPLSASFLLLKF